VQVIKFDWVVVTRRMQHHAVRRQACLFVADIGVADEAPMVIDGSPPVGAVPNEFAAGFAAPSTSWKRRCFVANENDRAAVRRNGFGHPARLRSVFIGGDLSYLLRRRPRRQRTEFYRDLTCIGENYLCNMVYYKVLLQN
jgi:hypothetical protein